MINYQSLSAELTADRKIKNINILSISRKEIYYGKYIKS